MPHTQSTPRIWFETHGEAGTPVLMLMGFGMVGSVWMPQVEAIRERHRVAFLDNRGVGQSDPVRGLMKMKDLAADALRVADELGWERFHLVGVSMGGMVAQEFTLQYPDRVRSLSLIATHAGGPLAVVPRAPGIPLFLEANRSRNPAIRIKALQRLLYPEEFLRTADIGAINKRFAGIVGRRAAGATLRAQLSAVLRHNTGRRLRDIRCPTMVVRPGRDILVNPRGSDALARGIPFAKLVRMDDAGHGVTFQCRERLNAALLDHFATVERTTLNGRA